MDSFILQFPVFLGGHIPPKAPVEGRLSVDWLEVEQRPRLGWTSQEI